MRSMVRLAVDQQPVAHGGSVFRAAWHWYVGRDGLFYAVARDRHHPAVNRHHANGLAPATFVRVKLIAKEWLPAELGKCGAQRFHASFIRQSCAIVYAPFIGLSSGDVCSDAFLSAFACAFLAASAALLFSRSRRSKS